MVNLYKRWLRAGIVTVLLFSLSLGLSGAWFDGGETKPKRESTLPAGNAITDGKALLRYALPIENEPIRKLQKSLEMIAERIRGKRWSPISGDIAIAARVLSSDQEKILASIPADQQARAQDLIDQLNSQIDQMRRALEEKDGETLLETRAAMLRDVGQVEELMVGEFPFEVPSEYANLPQLKGRATVEITTNKGKITLVADGYSAPVTAGNFVDLVQRGFYDGLKFIRSEASYVLQVGDPQARKRDLLIQIREHTGRFPWKFWCGGIKNPYMAIPWKKLVAIEISLYCPFPPMELWP